uniref:Uncharacterized protein n=1 Tax=Aegilops tauschii subsp. strangulata TaxID=200361 RepID=A0A453E6I3_AEGTS
MMLVSLINFLLCYGPWGQWFVPELPFQQLISCFLVLLNLHPPSFAGATHPLWHASSGKDAGSALLPPQEQPRPPVGPAIVSAIQNTLSVVSASSSPVTCNYLFPSFRFEEMGTLSSKTEVKTIELAQGGPSRLLFTGDGAGELKVWMWAPQGEESPTPALP